MTNENIQFNNCWLGFDLPYNKIENQNDVVQIRKEGIEKRVRAAEYHVTIGWFKTANLDQIAGVVINAEKALEKKLYQTIFDFDGIGRIENQGQTYVYFLPNPDSAPEAFFLKQFFSKSDVYDSTKNCQDLHLSIGGPDPLSPSKPKQQDLENPFSARGRLVFVGNDGKKFRRYEWHSTKQEFIEIDLAPMLGKESFPPSQPETKKESSINKLEIKVREPETKPSTERRAPSTVMQKWTQPLPVNTIAIFPKIQADTAVAVYLLKSFGGGAFPGIESAPLAFWSQAPENKSAAEHENDGTLLVDLGGRFDHHLFNEQLGKRQECVSTLIATYLGIDTHPALKKLLTWAKRDDLEGKGTISKDSLDRAFGLSGIIMNLNREYHKSPNQILDVVLPIIDAHVREEIRRTIEMPKEWEQMLKSGKADIFQLQQGPADIEVAVIESDNVALPGFIRAAKKIDLILQRRSTGHTNIITKQLRNIDLRPVAEALRLGEAEKKGIELGYKKEELQAPGRVEEVGEWYYDDAGNTIQNGGVNPEGITPTRLSKEEVTAILKDAIPHGKIGHIKRQREKGR